MANIQQALKQLVKDDPNRKQKGNRFERFIQKVFQEHPGAYGTERFSEVWLWSEWPDKDLAGLPEVNGIDLVAKQTEAYGGGLCAIQCKYWSKDTSVGKKEVATFVADMGRSKSAFSAGLFVSTAKLTSEAEGLLLNSSPMCQVLYTQTLDGWAEDWTKLGKWTLNKGFSKLSIKPAEKHRERDYQKEAREAAETAFASGRDRGKIIMPCGTGKMFVSLRTSEAIAGKSCTVLYLVPSLGLVHQTMQEWSEQRSMPLQYLGVCSDPSVAKKDDADSDVAGYMAEMAMPVTTDAAKIGEWLQKPCPSGTMRVLFSTYHSSPKIAEAIRDHADWFQFDLMILDEAHRTSGRDKSRSSGFVVPLHDDTASDGTPGIPAAKRLFFTATPRVFADKKTDAKNLDLDDEPDSYDMNDTAIYGGEPLYEMSFSEAIEEGWLSDYEVLVVTGSRDAFRDSLPIEDGKVVWNEKPDVAMDDLIRLVGAWDALASPETEEVADDHATGGIGETHLSSAICYLNKVADSKWTAEEWGGICDHVERCDMPSDHARLKLEVSHVDAKTPSDKRAEALNALKDTSSEGICSVVSNVGVFSEGVNVPNLDAVIFLDSRSSAVDIAQQIGRVMRKAPGKDRGYVILPVFVPEEADADKWLGSSDWKKLWRVVKALRSHDERMEEYLAHPKAMEQDGPIKLRHIRSRTGDTDPAKGSLAEKTFHEQRLFLEELKREIASRSVRLCGDRDAYPGWGIHAAKVAANIAERIKVLTAHEPHKQHLADFTKQLQNSVSKDITQEQAREMLAQHAVTIPIFDRMLGQAHFADKNLVSIAIRDTLTKLGEDPKDPFPSETAKLERAYAAMGRAFTAAGTPADRLDVLKSIYDGFFAQAMPTTTKELGIVYTPVELVDFVIRSCAAICEREFGRSIGSENVHVLDPFSGTGTFLTRLIEGINPATGEPWIADGDLSRKYASELHGNEIVLLAYYVAALTIEQARHQRNSQAPYAPFAGLCLSDTFEDFPAQGQLWGTGNVRGKQDELPMYVIFGNPPWSGGKKKAGDDASKKINPAVMKRVQDTFGKRHKELGGGWDKSFRQPVCSSHKMGCRPRHRKYRNGRTASRDSSVCSPQ